MMEPFELAQLAVKALDDKKARNIKVLKTDKQTVLADYFVICNGTSSTHIKALTETVDEVLSQAGELLSAERDIVPEPGFFLILPPLSFIFLRKKHVNFTIWNVCGATRKKSN